MPTDNISQIRGALLEELILHFLRKTGYRIISQVGTDTTLQTCSAGIQVKGRGCNHQIDAIADSVISHPFSFPQRLLIEAKCYAANYKIGIDKIRNAVGVLTDVCEYWTSQGAVSKSRYHYQYALFSTSPYTKEAERYAFAHDIYLIPLQNSTFLRRAIEIIRNISKDDFHRRVSVKELRETFRESWKNSTPPAFPAIYPFETAERLNELYDEGRRINFALLAVLGGSFPVFLIPSPEIILEELETNIPVRIFWNNEGWYLRSPNGQNLFSFDLPTELFELYATEGILTQNNAIELKENMMADFLAYRTINDDIQIIRFYLDGDWLNRIKQTIIERNLEQ